MAKELEGASDLLAHSPPPRNQRSNGSRHLERLRAAIQERVAISVAARNELVADMVVASLTWTLIRDLTSGYDLRTLLEKALDSAIRASHADFGNIQLLDPASGELRIYVQYGFGAEFLGFFNRVHEGQAACGSAMKTQERVVVRDITDSPIFADGRTLEIMLRAGVRAVQSTPLRTTSGEILGMLSTHYRVPKGYSSGELRRLAVVATSTSKILECWARSQCFPRSYAVRSSI